MPTVSRDTLDRYADLILHVGLGLKQGQALLVRAPVAAAPLVQSVAERAYRLGSGLVSVLYQDPEVARARLRHAEDEALDAYPAWQAQAANDVASEGTAVLTIVADDPDAYANEDPKRIARVQKAARKSLRPFYAAVTRDATNWCVVAMPIPAWAQRVFPEAAPEEAERRLWDAVLASVRLDRDDPVAAWEAHIDVLQRRAEHLSERSYRELRYRAPGTDLRVGLADDHVWAGPRSHAPHGAAFVANLPTEEVFTAPHRDRVEGVVRATRPLAHGGKIIDGFWLRFAGGAVVEAGAERGEAILHELLATDEGARRLGEVALVEASGPIARTGLLYFDTLFDENAASHLALGRAYAFSVRGGADRSGEELAERGLNDSLTHVDFMVGSAEVDVDGVRADGTVEPVMRGGAFVV